MPFDLLLPETRPATLIERENRFAVRARGEEGEIRLHLPNSGRLRFLHPGSLLRYQPREGPKTAGRVLLARDRGAWVLLDSGFAEEALPWLLPRFGYRFLRAQPRLGESRFDALVEVGGRAVPLEMKSATHVEAGVACFPDARSSRALRHLEALLDAGGVLVFAVLHPLARAFRPCPFDPRFTLALARAADLGLRIHAVRMAVSLEGLRWAETLPVYFSP